MSSKAFPRTLPMVIVVAVAGSLLIGTALSGFAQLGTESEDSFSGSVNNLVQQDSETSYVIGGDWQLSTDGDNVTDFSADITMVRDDGTGAHTHRVVLAGEDVGFQGLAEQEGNLTEDEEGDLLVDGDGDVNVILLPLEQNPGGTILVNASGLVANNETSVHVGDIAAGNPESDSDGNLLFALGITEDMTGSEEVTVTDGRNTGSATFTVIELAENETDNETEPENVTGTETGNLTGTVPGNLTGALPSNATETTDESGNMTGNLAGNLTGTLGNLTESLGNLTGMENSTQPQSTEQTDESIYGQDIFGQFGGPADTGATNVTDESANNVTDMGDTTLDTANATLTSDATSTETEKTGEITVSYDIVADIYTDGELKWEDVNVTISVMSDEIISIEIDPATTDNHFGDQPIFGLVD